MRGCTYGSPPLPLSLLKASSIESASLAGHRPEASRVVGMKRRRAESSGGFDTSRRGLGAPRHLRSRLEATRSIGRRLFHALSLSLKTDWRDSEAHRAARLRRETRLNSHIAD